MACKKCKTQKCTCEVGISTPTTFSNNPTACPVNSEKCTEIFDMHCICYEGNDIVELDIKQGDRLDEIFQKLLISLVNPSCNNFATTNGCVAPLNLMVSNLTSNTFDISWDEVVGTNHYVVEFKEATSLTWNVTPSIYPPNVSLGLYALTPGTVYDIKVTSVCATTSCTSLTIRVKTLTV